MFCLAYDGDKWDRSQVELVIARYKENLEWILPYQDIAIVYNKGEPLPRVFSNNSSIVKKPLRNIGREGHTYLYHMIRNYNCLASRTIFLQGSPFEHNHSILSGIENYDQHTEVQSMGLRYLQSRQLPPDDFVNRFKTVTPYGLEFLVMELSEDLDEIPPYNINDQGMIEIIQRRKQWIPPSESIFGYFLNRSKFPIQKSLDVVRFSMCGLFSVSRINIQQYPVEVYEGLMQELLSQDSQGGDNGYILERLWLYIFEN